MVDPYFYRDRLTMPKLLINGTNDRYWTLDALDLYWDDLKGPKYVVYLPNAGHGLDQNRDYAINGIGAFFRHVVDRAGRCPSVTWKFARSGDGPLRLTRRRLAEPKAAQLWTARSDSRDFRESRWEPSPMTAGPADDGRGRRGRPRATSRSSPTSSTRSTACPITSRPRSARSSRRSPTEKRPADARFRVPRVWPRDR